MVNELAIKKNFYQKSENSDFRDKTERTFYIGEDQLKKLQQTGNASEKLREIIDSYYESDADE